MDNGMASRTPADQREDRVPFGNENDIGAASHWRGDEARSAGHGKDLDTPVGLVLIYTERAVTSILRCDLICVHRCRKVHVFPFFGHPEGIDPSPRVSQALVLPLHQGYHRWFAIESNDDHNVFRVVCDLYTSEPWGECENRTHDSPLQEDNRPTSTSRRGKTRRSELYRFATKLTPPRILLYHRRQDSSSSLLNNPSGTSISSSSPMT